MSNASSVADREKLSLTQLSAQYDVHCKVWPECLISHGESHQIGFEVELLGSHSSAPSHVDPGCPTCLHVRHALLAIAEEAVRQLETAGPGLAECLVTQVQSVVCLPSSDNRSFSTASIHILHKSGLDGPLDQSDSDSRNTILGYLKELGVQAS